MLLNAWHEAVPFTVPNERYGLRWKVVIDTDNPGRRHLGLEYAAGETVGLTPRSVHVMRRLDDAAGDDV